jgi:hypothetical protein
MMDTSHSSSLQVTTYTNSEMLELVTLHFRDAFSERDYSKWDWSLPL